jgi:hypothetical protein
MKTASPPILVNQMWWWIEAAWIAVIFHHALQFLESIRLGRHLGITKLGLKPIKYET